MKKYLICIDGGEGGSETIEAASAQEALARAEDWARDGEWPKSGCCCCIGAENVDDERDCASKEIEIEPDHAALIRSAGGDTDCDHDWTADGEGGCSENPGVWSTGGTSMSFATHCRRCGLHRQERTTGDQKNPGEHDTTHYRLLAGDEIAEHRRNGDMDE